MTTHPESFDQLTHDKDQRALLRVVHATVAAETRARRPEPAFVVYVDDNFHFMDKSERYTLGTFPSEAEAVAAAQKVVDDFLLQGFRPGIAAEALLASYRQYGDDPWIFGSAFSAWDYAERRCRELCAAG